MWKTLAIVERELWRLARRPTLIVMALLLPAIQLLVLGYAVGGDIPELRVAVVGDDPVIQLLVPDSAEGRSDAEALRGIRFQSIDAARQALLAGEVHGVLAIPRDLRAEAVRIEVDSADKFLADAMVDRVTSALRRYDLAIAPELLAQTTNLNVTEVFGQVPYIQYLLAGVVSLAVFMMSTVGGGITFVDDKVRGVHEGYLVTPITTVQLVGGFGIAGVIKAALAGICLLVIGSVLADLPSIMALGQFLRLSIVVAATACALVGLTFVMIVRAQDLFWPRAMFAVANTALYFPSGALYPTDAFPEWMRVLSYVNPFYYSVHALRAVMLRSANLWQVQADLGALLLFAAVAFAIVVFAFKRTL
ncbi:MAG: ABC transporter permease [Hyphomicrobium sp.]|jgi:ABC-2 type transport system permease protein